MDFTQWACKLNILELVKSFQLKTKADIFGFGYEEKYVVSWRY